METEGTESSRRPLAIEVNLAFLGYLLLERFGDGSGSLLEQKAATLVKRGG